MANFSTTWPVCDCAKCFPRFYHTGDALGAHTLTVAGTVSAGNQSLFWQGTASAILDIWIKSGLNPCTHFGNSTQTITYKLSYYCTYTSDSGGPRWQFEVLFPAFVCDTTGQLQYGGFSGAFINLSAKGTIAFQCDPDLIVITVPSTYVYPPDPTKTIAVPGGGGTFSFVP